MAAKVRVRVLVPSGDQLLELAPEEVRELEVRGYLLVLLQARRVVRASELRGGEEVLAVPTAVGG